MPFDVPASLENVCICWGVCLREYRVAVLIMEEKSFAVAKESLDLLGNVRIVHSVHLAT